MIYTTEKVFGIQWENGLSGSGGYERIFWGLKCTNFKQKNQKKSVLICQIRPIRSPIVSPFSKAEIAIFVQQFLIWKNGGCRDAIYRVWLELDSNFY
jgi:hypothetical protein